MRGSIPIWALLALLCPLAAQAGTLATFAVDMSGSTVSGPTSGRILGIGTASLDSSGTLTILATTKAVTGWTESVQDSTIVIQGTLVGNVLSPADGRTAVTSCTRTGGFFDACSHVVLNRDQPFDRGALSRPIAFQLAPGQVTRFEAEQVRALGARVHYVFHLTALPEPPSCPRAISVESGATSRCSPGRGHVRGLRPAGLVAGDALANRPVVDGQRDGSHDREVPSEGQ